MINFNKVAIAKAINRPEPGVHPAQITKCSVRKSKKGNQMLMVTCTSLDGKQLPTDCMALPVGEDEDNQPNDYWLETSLFRINKLLEIAGEALEIESVNELPKLLMGTKLDVLIEHDMDDEGKISAQVADVYPSAPEEVGVKVSDAETPESPEENVNSPKQEL